MATRPLLFLDIDGVLNPVLPSPGFTAHDLLDHTVLLSVDHADWLRELSATYDLVWATTWEHHANTHIAPLLGLPELPVVEFTGHPGRPDDPQFEGPESLLARKWAPLLRHAAGQPFAWVDDVMPDSLVRRSRWRPDRLLIPVDPAHGLRRHHVDRLLAAPPRPRLCMNLTAHQH
ncbi:HAD domain-containing protein [Streptomyces sp. NPDC048483]|uniref:HAD domain-containing protein n=1 Tax=Streptomyces sp. NPDC048483 TaxID=3154927 RepID=UPI00341B2209